MEFTKEMELEPSHFKPPPQNSSSQLKHPTSPLPLPPPPPTYKECLRNHAAAIGGHALDGCGEFIAAAADTLTCAACNCHRNFHRKIATATGIVIGEPFFLSQFCPSLAGKMKRFRTKFTDLQKEKMVEMAEKLQWRIQRNDEAMVEKFCSEIGVRRRALKVWMHNNKNAFCKKP